MSEYFQGSPGIRMLLQYEFDKSMKQAQHEYNEQEMASQAKYDRELESLKHLNKISEIDTEHTNKRAEIGLSGEWNRMLAEDQRAWQSEENVKSRSHEAEQRSLDRQTDISTAWISNAGRAVETVPKLLPILGVGSNNNNKGNKNGNKPDPNDPSTLKPGTIEYANYVFDHGPIIAPDLKSKVTGFVVNSAGEMTESKKDVPWYAYAAAPYVAAYAVGKTNSSMRSETMNPELVQKLINSFGVPAAGVAVTNLLRTVPLL